MYDEYIPLCTELSSKIRVADPCLQSLLQIYSIVWFSHPVISVSLIDSILRFLFQESEVKCTFGNHYFPSSSRIFIQLYQQIHRCGHGLEVLSSTQYRRNQNRSFHNQILLNSDLFGYSLGPVFGLLFSQLLKIYGYRSAVEFTRSVNSSAMGSDGQRGCCICTSGLFMLIAR